jgi:DNA-binding response OmpR family regulator
MVRILVVDDNEEIVQMLSYILTDEGHDFAGCVESTEAVGLAKAFAPDLIVLNTCMPFLDGFQVALLLGRDETLRTVPIIMTTACGVLSGWSAHELALLGIVACVSKPFEISGFLEDVNRILQDHGGGGSGQPARLCS